MPSMIIDHCMLSIGMYHSDGNTCCYVQVSINILEFLFCFFIDWRFWCHILRDSACFSGNESSPSIQTNTAFKALYYSCLIFFMFWHFSTFYLKMLLRYVCFYSIIIKKIILWSLDFWSFHDIGLRIIAPKTNTIIVVSASV